MIDDADTILLLLILAGLVATYLLCWFLQGKRRAGPSLSIDGDESGILRVWIPGGYRDYKIVNGYLILVTEVCHRE